MASDQINRKGFTLIEVLVGLAVAGMLAAIIASVIGRSIVSSQALLDQEKLGTQKTTLRTIMHRDIKSMILLSELTPVSEGFILHTGHNTLIPSSLPVEVSWIFSHGEIVRTEQNIDLDYSKQQVLSTGMRSFSLDLFCPVQGRWLGLDNWLAGQNRPQPAALRLKLDLEGSSQIEIIEHLPGHE